MGARRCAGWNRDGSLVQELIHAFGYVAEAVAWTGDGKHIVSSDLDATLHIWNVETGKLERKSVVLSREKFAMFSADAEA
jgi:WD40 repeat protein